MPSRSWGLLALLVPVLPISLPARTITVSITGPKDFATIQEAIDAAEQGDTVLVGPGEYQLAESLSFRGKDIALKSQEGPEDTILNRGVVGLDDVPERASVVIFEPEIVGSTADETKESPGPAGEA